MINNFQLILLHKNSKYLEGKEDIKLEFDFFVI